MAAYDKAHGQRILDYFDEHYYFNVSTPAAQLASTRTLWDPTYNGGTWVEQWDFNGPMQLIPRFRSWISTYYPGTLLSLSEYSIDSGQKSIVDAIAEMDVLGIFGQQPIDFANMWSAPAPTDPIAYAFRMFRNYDGNGSQFGDTSISAVSTDPGDLSIYAAQRSSDNAVTILAINKTTGALSSAIAIANLNLPSTAQVYTYSQATLTSIVHASDAAITSGSISYSFPSYSAVLFVIQPNAATVTATTTSLSASAAQITVGQSVTFSVTVTPAAGSAAAGNVTLLDGSTPLGTSALASGTVTFTITSLAAGTHSITASYAGDSTDGASTSNAVSVQVNAATPTSGNRGHPYRQPGNSRLGANNHTHRKRRANFWNLCTYRNSYVSGWQHRDRVFHPGYGHGNACDQHVECRNPFVERGLRRRRSRFAIHFQDGFGNHHRSCSASSDTCCRLWAYSFEQHSDHGARHARILDGFRSSGKRIQCVFILRLLRTAEWVGLQLCALDAIRKCARKHKDDHQRYQQQPVDARSLRAFLALVSPIPLFFFGLSREGPAGRNGSCFCLPA